MRLKQNIEHYITQVVWQGDSTGFAVKVVEPVLKGEPICLYKGNLVSKEEAEQLAKNYEEWMCFMHFLTIGKENLW